MSTTTTAPAPAWTHLRPWRNNNPGDLRCLPGSEKWDGQTGVDDGPGGPFAIFENQTMGWRALAVCLLTYFDRDGMKTVFEIIHRYAPAVENDTDGYVRLVCTEIGCEADEPINLRNVYMLEDIMAAIALAEGGARINWNPALRTAGAQMALGIVPKPPAPSAATIAKAA